MHYDEILSRLQELMSEEFSTEPEDIQPETGFAELGADELDWMELFFMLEEEFGTTKKDEKLMKELETVGALCTYLAGRQK